MELAWLVDLCAFLLYIEILRYCCHELLRCKSVKVLHHAVIVDDLEVALRECHCHEPVIFLVSCMGRIAFPLLCAYTGCSCCTVVTVSHIESRNLREKFCYAVDVSLLVDHPEMMAEAVSCNEIILRLAYDVFVHDGVDLIIVRI